MKMRKLLAFTLTAAALAQAPIQVTTRLVEVTVVVRDKHGAVADLRKSDFEILDKGKPRQIATFSMARASDHVSRSPLPPGTFSNRQNRQGDSPVSATVLLFDGLNTPFKDQAAARQQLLTLVKTLDPASPIAIYALGGELRIVHDFTEDPVVLKRAIDSHRSTPSTLLADSQSAADSARVGTPPATSLSATANPLARMDRAFQSMNSYALDNRVEITLAAMNAIAKRLAGVPGRKNLIWVSGAFPLTIGFDRSGLTGSGERSAYAGIMNDAAAAIDRANVAVYPVDPRGIVGKPGTREVATMQLLAEWTGGRAYFNTNDIGGAVKQAMEDAEITYSLGFYPEEEDTRWQLPRAENKARSQRRRRPLPQRILRHFAPGRYLRNCVAISSRRTAQPGRRDSRRRDGVTYA